MAKVRQLNPKTKTNDEVTIIIKEKIFKEYITLLGKNATEYGYKIVKSKKKADKKSPAHVVIKILEEYKKPEKTVRLGALIEELKYKAAAEVNEKGFKEKKRELNVLSLKFPRYIAPEFKEEYGDKLMLHKTVGRKSETEFQFDVSDCLNRSQLVNRVLSIADAVQDIKDNKRTARDKHHIEAIIKVLHDHCSYMKKTSESLVHMTGTRLIKLGYATVWDIDSATSKFFQKIYNWLFKEKEHEYFYMGRLVVPEQVYIVKLHKSEPRDEQISFKDEIWRRYIYGEQLYIGYGMELVNKFETEIIDAHNEGLISSSEVLPKSTNNPKVPKRKTAPPPPPPPPSSRKIGDK